MIYGLSGHGMDEKSDKQLAGMFYYISASVFVVEYNYRFMFYLRI